MALMSAFIEPGTCHSLTDWSKVSLADWTIEPKMDGFRLQLHVGRGEVRYYTRAGREVTGRLPHVEEALRDWATELGDRVCVFDAEVVYLNGSADFNYTARVMGSGVEEAVRKQRHANKHLTVLAFDALVCMGEDVTGQPIELRREMVKAAFPTGRYEFIRPMDWEDASLEAHERFTKEYGEGSILKRRGSQYTSGRGRNWLKVKATFEEDVVVLGMTPGQGKYEGLLGAIIFGQYKNGELVQRGQCSGFTDEVRRELTRILPVGKVMVISHNGYLVDGFRHPQFKAFRDDKRPDQCRWTYADGTRDEA